MAKALGRGSVWRIALRSAGVLIAIAAAIDPAITSTRNSRPLVSVAAIDASADSAVAVQVARALRDDAQVVPALFGRADATVLVGNDVPHDQDDLATPVFVVRDDSRPQLNIRTVRAPTRASVHSRVHIQVDVQARGARGRELDVVLRAGAIAVDRHRVTITSDDTVASVPLSFAPTLAGAAALRVEAILVGANSVSTTASPTRALADLLVAVTTQPLAVLVYDSRPSWMSTFVRRALERDLRLVVTSRVVTSRSISTSAGSAPERLDELASMARFDAIVVGAPESLTSRDVAGLEAFMRRRGGSVVLLLDKQATGPYEQLMGVSDWRYRNDGVGVPITPNAASDNSGVVSTELRWPAELPEGAMSLAQTVGRRAPDGADTTDRHPVVWQRPVGAGRLVVSGALDAWRFRDSPGTGFDGFWQAIIADAAGEAVPSVTATLGHDILAPGETTDLSVVVRDAALTPAAGGDIRTRVSATLQLSAGNAAPVTDIGLWPEGPVGYLRGTVRAPDTPGRGTVVVVADGHRVELEPMVDPARRRATADAEQLISSWAASRGGRVIARSALPTLAEEIRRVVRASPRRERWHPMRSPWWILPFALALSAEWWYRRRRSLP